MIVAALQVIAAASPTSRRDTRPRPVRELSLGLDAIANLGLGTPLSLVDPSPTLKGAEPLVRHMTFERLLAVGARVL